MEDWWIGGGLRRISPKAEPRSGRGGGNDGFEGAPPSVLCVQELLSRGDGDGFKVCLRAEYGGKTHSDYSVAMIRSLFALLPCTAIPRRFMV